MLSSLLLASPAVGASFRVAFIPPHDRKAVVTMLRGHARLLKFDVTELAPEDFVGTATFAGPTSKRENVPRYHAAVYTGGERYLYTAKRTGDGVAALLRYLSEGGTLIVSGGCWPFYRPLDWQDGEYVRSQGAPSAFAGPEDKWLREQMGRLNQTSVGNFNRYLGLNIAGEGTRQYEKPPEPIAFTRGPAARLFPSLPGKVPFPEGGDQRYRPASAQHLGSHAKFSSVAEAYGASGVAYGTGICVVEHTGGRLSGGIVIYLCEPLTRGELGRALLLDACKLAARHAGIGNQEGAELVAAAQREEQRIRDLRNKIERLEVWPERSYFARSAAELQRRVGSTRDAATFGNLPAARDLLDGIRRDSQILMARVQNKSR